MGFKVQKRMCKTCIYRKESPLDLKKLEDDVRDPHIGFKGHRICHHSKDVCCRGFWQRHKDKFPAGQIAQRLGLVVFVDVDTLKRENGRLPGAAGSIRPVDRSGECHAKPRDPGAKPEDLHAQGFRDGDRQPKNRRRDAPPGRVRRQAQKGRG